MAKGKDCPYCHKPMYILHEKKYPAGFEVVYSCHFCGHKEKVFEDK